MRVDILCSGSKGNSTLIRSGSTSILLDCGPSALRTIKEGLVQAGSSMDQLQAVLITHTHGDHIRQLRHFAWLPIYAYCDLRIRDPKKQPVHLTVHHITPLLPFRIGCLLITPIALSHDAGPTCGFIIQDAYEKLVYITDTGYVQREVMPLLRGADYYVFESNHDVDMLMNTNRPYSLKQRIASDTGHLNNVTSARILAHLITPKTRHVVLAHLSEEANTPQLAMDTFMATMDHYQLDTRHFKLHCAAQYSALQIGELEETPAAAATSSANPRSASAKPSPKATQANRDQDTMQHLDEASDTIQQANRKLKDQKPGDTAASKPEPVDASVPFVPIQTKVQSAARLMESMDLADPASKEGSAPGDGAVQTAGQMAETSAEGAAPSLFDTLEDPASDVLELWDDALEVNSDLCS